MATTPTPSRHACGRCFSQVAKACLERLSTISILDLALALVEDRRRDIVRKTRNGLDAARKCGRTGGRPRVIDADKCRIVIARHLDGESIRTIAGATKLSIAPSTPSSQSTGAPQHRKFSAQSCSITTRDP